MEKVEMLKLFGNEVEKIMNENPESDYIIFPLDTTFMNDNKRLGHALVESGYLNVPEELKTYMDYEKIGRDYDLKNYGEFTKNYYIQMI